MVTISSTPAADTGGHRTLGFVLIGGLGSDGRVTPATVRKSKNGGLDTRRSVLLSLRCLRN